MSFYLSLDKLKRKFTTKVARVNRKNPDRSDRQTIILERRGGEAVRIV